MKVLDVALNRGILSRAEADRLRVKASNSDKKKMAGKKIPASEQLLREITSMKSGYGPMAHINCWFLPLFKLALKLVREDGNLNIIEKKMEKYLTTLEETKAEREDAGLLPKEE